MGCGVSTLALEAERSDPRAPPAMLKPQSTVQVDFNKTSVRALRRISNELKDIQDHHPEFTVTPLNIKESYFDWVAILPGPAASPYAGGEFVVDVTFQTDYPLTPPKLKFRTPVFHPNMSSSGKVCLNILKSGEWSPVLSLGTVLISVQALLSDPNPDDPLNVKAADLLIKDAAAFALQARSCTVKYASPGTPKTRNPQHAEEEDEQEFEHLQRDQSGRLVDEDELLSRLTAGRHTRRLR